MQSRMEMIYIDSDRQARKTGVGAIFDTPVETWRAFRSVKRLNVEGEKAEFLLDYYNRKGDLADTIGLRRRDFERVTGEKAKTEAEYREIDRAYWSEAMREAGKEAFGLSDAMVREIVNENDYSRSILCH